MLASNIQSWAWVVSLNGYGNETPTCEFEKEQKTTLPSTPPNTTVSDCRKFELLAETAGSPPSTAPVEWADAGEPDPSDAELWDALYSYAPKVIELAKSYGISILMLQPLNQFEGWEKGTKREVWSRAKAEKWLPLCAKLGVEQIQVSGTDDPGYFFSVCQLMVLGWIQRPPSRRLSGF